jgi:glutamyl-tRNA reductase
LRQERAASHGGAVRSWYHEAAEETTVDLAVLGLKHDQAPVAVRERVALTAGPMDRFYAALSQVGADGAVALSTCNRTEIYWTGSVPVPTMTELWADAVGVAADTIRDHAFLYWGRAAVTHLFSVAAGLDSMMFGETQILGQVKDAYQTAQAAGVVGRLHRVFLAALRVGKRAHAETGISENALSVGYAGVELARKVFGDLGGVTALVVGAGDMGTLVARHLRGAGVGRMWVMNRTPERAQSLAAELQATAVPFDRLADNVAGADLVVSSTANPAVIVTEAMVRRGLRLRRGRPWLFLDLSVPRNVAPGVERLHDSVFRYDIDDLKTVVDVNRARREREADQVRRIIAEEEARLQADLDVSQVGPLIRSLRDKADSIRRAELERVYQRLPGLSERERQVVARATELMVNKILNDPMVSIRGWAERPEGSLYLSALKELFRLDEDPPPVAPKD